MGSADVPEPIVFPADERPDVELLWEGQRCPGELRMQTYEAQASGYVTWQYRRPGELSSHIGTFSASAVRQDTMDRGAGRGGVATTSGEDA